VCVMYKEFVGKDNVAHHPHLQYGVNVKLARLHAVLHEPILFCALR
jgi:hypothetical protein